MNKIVKFLFSQSSKYQASLLRTQITKKTVIKPFKKILPNTVATFKPQSEEIDIPTYSILPGKNLEDISSLSQLMEEYQNNKEDFDHTNIYVIVRAVQRLSPTQEEVLKNETFNEFLDWVYDNLEQLSLWTLIYCLETFPLYRDPKPVMKRIDQLIEDKQGFPLQTAAIFHLYEQLGHKNSQVGIMLIEQLEKNNNFTAFSLMKVLHSCQERHKQIFYLVCSQLETHVGGNISFQKYVSMMKKISDMHMHKPPQLFAKIEEYLLDNFQKLSIKMIQDLLLAYQNLPKESQLYKQAYTLLKNEFYASKFILSIKILIQYLAVLPDISIDILNVLQKRINLQQTKLIQLLKILESKNQLHPFQKVIFNHLLQIQIQPSLGVYIGSLALQFGEYKIATSFFQIYDSEDDFDRFLKLHCEIIIKNKTDTNNLLIDDGVLKKEFDENEKPLLILRILRQFEHQHKNDLVFDWVYTNINWDSISVNYKLQILKAIFSQSYINQKGLDCLNSVQLNPNQIKKLVYDIDQFSSQQSVNFLCERIEGNAILFLKILIYAEIQSLFNSRGTLQPIIRQLINTVEIDQAMEFTELVKIESRLRVIQGGQSLFQKIIEKYIQQESLEENQKIKICIMAIENNILIDEFMKETTKEQEDDQKFNNLEDMVNYCRIKLYLNEDVDKSIQTIQEQFMAEKDQEKVLNALLILIEYNVKQNKGIQKLELFAKRNIKNVENIVHWLSRLKYIRQKYKQYNSLNKIAETLICNFEKRHIHQNLEVFNFIALFKVNNILIINEIVDELNDNYIFLRPVKIVQCLQLLAQTKINQRELVRKLYERIRKNEKYHSPIEMYDSFNSLAKLGFKDLILVNDEVIKQIVNYKEQKQFEYSVYLLWSMIVTDYQVDQQQLLLDIFLKGIQQYQSTFKSPLAIRQLVDVYNYLTIVHSIQCDSLSQQTIKNQQQNSVPDIISSLINYKKIEHYYILPTFKIDIYLPDHNIAIFINNYQFVNFNQTDKSGFALLREKIAQKLDLQSVIYINQWEWMQMKVEDREEFINKSLNIS